MDDNRYDGYQNTSGSGNGTYQYSQNDGSSNGGDSYQSSYSSGYNTNGGGAAGGSGNHNHNKKNGRGGKVAFAIALAAVFGICAGAGAYGISRVSGNQTTASVAEASTEGQGEGATLSIAEGNSSSSSDTESSAAASSTESASEDSSTDSSASLGLQTSDAEAQENTVTKIVAKDMPSIVAVYNNYTSTSQDFFGQTYSQEQTATGSGIIIGKTDDELLIVTNNHVVADEDSLQVQFVDESTADANIKGTDSDMDLAVIAVKLADLSDDTKNAIAIATLGNSDNLKVGQSVIAIGNALGYGQSVTTGVVSALNREIADSENGTTNKFPYKVYLHVYLNNNIGEPDRNINITNTLATDGVVSMSEVKNLIPTYYSAKNSDGIGYDGLYLAKGNWVKDYVTDSNKVDKLKDVDVRTGEEYVHINVMITNAKAKSSSTADSSNPKTGDAIFMTITVMGLSAAALTGMYFYDKKRKVL